MTDSGIRQQAAALPANAITVAPVGIAHANFNTIAAALAFAVAGETILIFPGTYAESNLTLKANVDLVGTDPDQCIISVNDGVNPIVNSGVTCTISNLTIINQNAGQPAIRVTANTLTLRECRISGTGGGDAIQMTGGTLNAYDTTIVVGDIELSTAACTLAMYHCRANYIETTAAALAHSLTFEHCHIGSEICSDATGATTITLRHCSGITNISHAGTGTSNIYHCTFTNLNNTSTADWNIYESDILGTLWNASTGHSYCVNCHVNDISCDNAVGTVECWGGLVRNVIDCTGKVLWYVAEMVLRVLDHDMLVWAVSIGAGKTIILKKGTYGIPGTLVMTAACRLVGEGCAEDVIIEHGSNTNATISSNVLCSLTNITLSQSQNGPTLKVTGQTTTLRNCRLIRDVAGDSIVMTGGYLNIYDTLIREGDINLSTAICTLTVYHSQFQQVRAVSQIETAGNFAHVIKLSHCDLGGQNINSAATGATTIDLRDTSNVGTITNAGTGAVTEWIDDTPVDGELHAPISSNWAYAHIAAADPHPLYCLEKMGANLDPNGHKIGPPYAGIHAIGNMGATPTIDFATNGYWQTGTVNLSWTSACVLPDPGVCMVYHIYLTKSDDAIERTLQWTGVTWLNNDTLSTLGTTAKARFLVSLNPIAAGVWIGSYSTAGTG
jgi:hypothetical protein